MRPLPLAATAALAIAIVLLAHAPIRAQAQAAPAVAPSPTVPGADQLVVVFAPGVGADARQETRAAAGSTVVKALGSKGFQLLRPRPGRSTAATLAALRRDPAVSAVQTDAPMFPLAVPNDPLFGQQWGLRNVGQRVDGASQAVPGADIGLTSAWDRTVGDPSIVVADLDSGIRSENPDLQGRIVSGFDFVGSDYDHPAPDGDPTDDDLVGGGHGVHTAGIVGAAGNDGIGVSGVSQNARIMPLRVCSRSTDQGQSLCRPSAIVDAVNYAGSHGARVANISIGGGPQPAIDQAMAANPHVLFVISAGNSGADDDDPSSGSLRSYPCVNAPAPGAVDNVICVAATDQADQLASFSNWGTASVDLGAPGVDVLSTLPIYATPQFSDGFEGGAAAFATTWAGSQFGRTDAAPLTSFGMASSPPSSAQPVNTTRIATSAVLSIPSGAGTCTLSQRLSLALGQNDFYQYGFLVSGTFLSAIALDSTSSTTVRAALGTNQRPPGASVRVQLRYTTGSTPGAGAYVDNVRVTCIAPVGQGVGTGFLDGTSMAAPTVSGAAALLLSAMPSASVAQVRTALLGSTVPLPALAGRTVTGGRLDVVRALDYLLLPPAAPLVAEPNPGVTQSSVTPPSRKTTKKAVTRCVVPKLAGRTLKAATAALKRAHCKLGRVTKPKRGTRLRVQSSRPAAGSRTTSGAKVAVVLASKRASRSRSR